MSATNSGKQSRDLKHRVLTCLHRLSDRDTHSAAASDLDSLAASLSAPDLPPFISAISAVDSSDKSPVRRHCVRLFSLLADRHGDSLSPHLSRILSALVRRLRDSDSAVRSACAAAAFSLSSRLTSTPFGSIAKPFLESLFTEQDANAQNGAALCLVAVIEGSGNPDAGSLRKALPRLEKLAKCEGFKAKAGVLGLFGSVVGVVGVLGSNGGKNLVRNVVLCLMEFLSSEDWAARKAAAEGLMKMAAAAEGDCLWEFKGSCLKAFEAKRFDKVKAVRETMNQMIEAWKEIPDLPDEVSPPPESQGSSKENASDGRYPPSSKTPNASQLKKSNPLNNQAIKTHLSDGSPASTVRRRISVGENKTTPPIFRKLDHKKPSNSKAGIAAPIDSSRTVISEDDPLYIQKAKEERRQFSKPGVRRALFTDNNSEKQNLGSGSSVVVPGGEETVAVSNGSGDTCTNNQRDCEDLSLIRKQLVQIENQQSNLLDVLQRFIGSSQNGIHSLEARVHGLELALDEISFDLAVSTGRMSQNNAAGCCKLPGSDFLSSKLFRKAEARPSISRLPVSMVKGDAKDHALENRKNRFNGRRGLIMNPLAEIPRSSQGLPEVSSSGVANSVSV